MAKKKAQKIEDEIIESQASEGQDTPEANSTWSESLISDLNDVISKFLPLSDQAAWSLKYHSPVLESYENGDVKLDESSCVGATMYIQFNFKDACSKELINNQG